ncbi:MAG: hypothetical protein HMLKMBBP_03222 [Planctomycetes bacterium]|nr:hypothetical protein [Planctomycetota bacterium]
MHALARLISAEASFRIFRAFGCTIRLHWLTFLVPLGFWLGFSEWLPSGEAGLWTAAWTLALYATIWSHEMGHVLAGRHVGIQTRTITLWPLGGLAHLDRRPRTPGTEMFVSAAGPAVHLLWFTLVGAPYFAFLHDGPPAVWRSMLEGFVWLQTALLVFNLLPIYPLDGGSILRGFLAKRMHPNRATLQTAYIGLAGNVVLGLSALTAMLQSSGAVLRESAAFMLWWSIGGVIACWRLSQEARWNHAYDEGPEEPWKASIPQASWNADDDADTAEAALEAVGRKKSAGQAAKRETGRAAKAEAARAASKPRSAQERVDAILDRINELGGIDRLSDAERRELADASEELRRSR